MVTSLLSLLISGRESVEFQQPLKTMPDGFRIDIRTMVFSGKDGFNF